MPKMKLRPHNSKVCSSLPHFLGFEHLQSPHDGQALGWGKKRPPACHPGQTRDPFKGIQFKGVTTGTSQGCDEKRKECMYIRLPGSGNPAGPQQGTKMPPNLSEASLRAFFCLLFIAMAHTARVPVLLQKATKSHTRGWQTACEPHQAWEGWEVSSDVFIALVWNGKLPLTHWGPVKGIIQPQ